NYKKTAPLAAAIKFHENLAKNVTSTVFTCFHYIHLEKNAPPTGGHVFSPIPTIFKLVRDINKTNVLTNFHDNWAKIVTSRVFTRKMPRPLPTNFHGDWAKIVTSRVFTRKTAPPTGGHVFQRIGTTFELNQDIIKTNILTNLELGRDFIGTKLLTSFMKMGQEMWPIECLQENVNGRTDIRRTKTGHKSSPEQSV
ncbi:hypothetical protein DPMN_175383, partial [Dreissena polymorpha]